MTFPYVVKLGEVYWTGADWCELQTRAERMNRMAAVKLVVATYGTRIVRLRTKRTHARGADFGTAIANSTAATR